MDYDYRIVKALFILLVLLGVSVVTKIYIVKLTFDSIDHYIDAKYSCNNMEKTK